MPSFAKPCPTCKREVLWGPESPYRPFCSDRCRLIDLGAWFSGERAIPSSDAASSDFDFDADEKPPRTGD